MVLLVIAAVVALAPLAVFLVLALAENSFRRTSMGTEVLHLTPTQVPSIHQQVQVKKRRRLPIRVSAAIYRLLHDLISEHGNVISFTVNVTCILLAYIGITVWDYPGYKNLAIAMFSPGLLLLVLYVGVAIKALVRAIIKRMPDE